MSKNSRDRQCKYCTKPRCGAYDKRTGRNKGYYTTCGSAACLKQQYKDDEVNAAKRTRVTRVCEFCAAKYQATAHRQRWCFTCVPDKTWRGIAQRYGLSKPAWDAFLAKQNGTCALCPNEASVVDHDHATMAVRGLLCYRCNLLVSAFDAPEEWIQKAMTYVRGV